MASCTALVPFSHASPFTDALRLPERQIAIGARTFLITQAWAPDGRGGTGRGEEAAGMGFGGSVYGCSIALAHHLCVARPELIRGRAVLELGAGLALASLAAAAHGAARVVATDGDGAVVALAAAAAARNGVAEGPSFSVRRLRWGVPGDAVAGMEVVVAADVVAAPYARSLRALADTVELLLPPAGGAGGSGGGVFVLAYQRRGAEERAFFSDMDARGWAREEVGRDALLGDFREAQPGAQPVQIFVFQRRAI